MRYEDGRVNFGEFSLKELLEVVESVDSVLPITGRHGLVLDGFLQTVGHSVGKRDVHQLLSRPNRLVDRVLFIVFFVIGEMR